jgi:single-strand DNA-binding protein
MAGLNKVLLIGRLGHTPEAKYTQSGTAITNITLATSETWKDKTTGEKQEKTEWHKIVFYRGLAEVVAKYCTKGMQIFVEGRIQTRTYDDKEGNKRYVTEIIGNGMQMLSSKGQGSQSQDRNDNVNHDYDSDIPF